MTNDNDMRMRDESKDNPIKDDSLITVTIGDEVVFSGHTAVPLDKNNFSIRRGPLPPMGGIANYLDIPTDTDKAFKLACKWLAGNVDECPRGINENFGEDNLCDDKCKVGIDKSDCWEAFFRWDVCV